MCTSAYCSQIAGSIVFRDGGGRCGQTRGADVKPTRSFRLRETRHAREHARESQNERSYLYCKLYFIHIRLRSFELVPYAVPFYTGAALNIRYPYELTVYAYRTTGTLRGASGKTYLARPHLPPHLRPRTAR